ncbi:MAG: hypothetical protein AAF478_07425 [Pseudomonadota bacterium]
MVDIPYIDKNLDPKTGLPRPRFRPSARLRKLGYSRQNLKHEDGMWFAMGEAREFSEQIEVEAKKREKRKKAGVRIGATKTRSTVYTLEALFDDWQSPKQNPKFKTENTVDGKRTIKCYATKTRKFYEQNAKRLAECCPEAWACSADALDKTICYGMYEQIWIDRGLATARAAIATLSTALAWGIRRGKINFQVNPANQLGMDTCEPRVRVGSIEEIQILVETADELGLPEIGDMITIAVWTGQRQADRLAMEDKGLINGHRYFRQIKTGKIVSIPQAPEIDRRLEASRKRRKSAGVIDSRVVLNEHSWVPFLARWYVSKYHLVRAKAAETLPSVATLTDQDFRDTAVTWLAMAGCSIPEICAITGHELESATRVLRHYLDLNAELAGTGMAKMVEWHEQEMKSFG